MPARASSLGLVLAKITPGRGPPGPHGLGRALAVTMGIQMMTLSNTTTVGGGCGNRVATHPGAGRRGPGAGAAERAPAASPALIPGAARARRSAASGGAARWRAAAGGAVGGGAVGRRSGPMPTSRARPRPTARPGSRPRGGWPATRWSASSRGSCLGVIGGGSTWETATIAALIAALLSSPRAPEVHSAFGLSVDAQRRADPLSCRRGSGMETITTGHFQWLACRHSFSVHLTGLPRDGCASACQHRAA